MPLECDKCKNYVPRYRIKKIFSVWLCTNCDKDRTMERKEIVNQLTDDEEKALQDGGWSAYVLARKLAEERLEKENNNEYTVNSDS